MNPARLVPENPAYQDLLLALNPALTARIHEPRSTSGHTAGALWGPLWGELSREFRRHAGHDHPSALRERLRHLARTTAARAAAREPRPVAYPRRFLRERPQGTLSPELQRQGREAILAAGIDERRPIVAFEPCGRADTLAPALALLADRGYQVITVDDPGEVLVPGDGGMPKSLFDVYVILSARFVICGPSDVRLLAYATSTPALTLNASDPFSGYPVRDDGLFTLRQPIDLDSGRRYERDDLLREPFFRNLRNCGFRDTPAPLVLAAVEEMLECLDHGWRESESQARFRERVVEAGLALAPAVAHVAAWGPDAGFIGDGRLARCQADGGLTGPEA
jgi:hypothetical protein